MRRVIAIVLSCVLILAGCSQTAKQPSAGEDISSSSKNEAEGIIEESEEEVVEEEEDEDRLVDNPAPVDSKVPAPEPEFSKLNDPELLDYVEKEVYADVSSQLGDEYQVENVSTTYISKEYIEELAYNSQTNVFFGYSLSDLDEQFQGTRYVFTLGENGETTVVPLEGYDDTYEKVIRNVAIGTGVILVCVTVSAVTGGAGAPAVSMIFAASAKSGAIFAASSGTISGVIAGSVTGMQTHDFNEALKAGALAGSEAFKWGAVTGAVTGGGSELVMLKTAARGGLSLDEAAIIIKDTKLPANFVKQIHSMDEYNALLAVAEKGGLTLQEMSNVCMSTGYPLELVKMFRTTKEGTIYFEQAGLYAKTVNGQAALIRTIDLNYKSELAGKTVTNLERMKQGYAAIDPASGKPFQLHHIGQSVDSPLAMLTRYEHTGGGNNLILHDQNIEEGVHSLISNVEWAAQKADFWEAVAVIFE